MKHLYKKIASVIGITVFCTNLSAQQTYINKEWSMSNGNPGQYGQVACDIDPSGNLVYIGSHLNNSANTDIFLNCIHPNGNVVWQQTCPSSATQDDYGSDLKIDATGNIYVTGARHNGNNLDYFVAKYNQMGVLQWQKYYNGNANGDDVPSAIDIDANGNVYVVGTSFGGSTITDILTIKYDNNGNQQWVEEYNFNNKVEVATDIKVDNAGNILILGASSQNWTNSNFIVRKYDSNGSVLATKRHNSPGNGYDLPTELAVDVNDNVFVTGTSESNGNKNIKLIAYNSSLQVQWVKYIDRSGQADEGFGIAVDQNGDVIITGYSTKSSGGTDAVIAKYNGANGNQLWINNKTALIDSDFSKARKVKIGNNNIIYVTSETTINGSKDFSTLSYKSTGELIWEKTFDNAANGADNSREIIVGGNNVYITGISNDGTTDKFTTVKYSLKEKPLIPVTDVDGTQYVDNELLIRFDSSAIIKDVIDKRDFTFGTLADFVKPNVLNELELKTGFSWKGLSTFKIFLRMTTADSISITRLGDTTRLDDFWATLSVYIPVEYNEQQTADSISTLYPTIQYAERNFIYQIHAAPNDQLYLTDQSGLFHPGHGIEVESAWDKQVGQTYTKIGSFDTGINWRHEDYGDGTSSGTKIVGGWNFDAGVSPFSETEPDSQGHGTATSGIYGALRNNNIGIAGIAGGDVQNGNTGCQVFSFKISIGSTSNISTAYAAPAIVEGAAYNPNTGYGYGLHIQNHSWGGTTYSTTMRDAVKSCYQNSCIFVASSGNTGDATINYPASYKDEWALKVGANDASGGRASFSTYGNDLDVVAPGTNDIYSTLDNFDNSGYSYNGDGTSFAAPMATGACGLLYSEHNTNNSYPNNLAPEDVEVFLQSFKTDVPPTGYDSESGHGRINTDYALTRLSLPEYFVKHRKVVAPMIPTISIDAGLQVNVINNVNNVAAGNYWADRYEVTYTFLNTFAPSQTVISHWPRYSSSIGINWDQSITGDTWFTYTPTINQNAVSVTTTTYCWYVTSSLSGAVVNKWIPANPYSLQTAFSLYVKDNAVVGIDENELGNGLNIYPNPTNNQIIVDYNLTETAEANLIVYDAIGKIVANHDMNNQATGQHSVTIDLSHLSNGLYIVNLTVGSQVISKRIIKN